MSFFALTSILLILTAGSFLTELTTGGVVELSSRSMIYLTISLVFIAIVMIIIAYDLYEK